MSFVASASIGSSGAGDLTVNKPTGTAENDLVVLMITQGAGSDVSMTWPSGFTQFANNPFTTGENITMKAAWKYAGASEPSTYTVGGVTDYAVLVSAAWRGRVNETPTVVNSSDTSTEATPITMEIAGLTAEAGDDVAYFARASTQDNIGVNYTADAGFTEREDLASSGASWTTATLATKDNLSAGTLSTLSAGAARVSGPNDMRWLAITFAMNASGGGGSLGVRSYYAFG